MNLPTTDELTQRAVESQSELHEARREAQRWKNRYYELHRELASLKQILARLQNPQQDTAEMAPRPPIARRSARKSEE
jgi:uncharacterized protein (DUF3084 family)